MVSENVSIHPSRHAILSVLKRDTHNLTASKKIAPRHLPQTDDCIELRRV
jgi:hypothetical protein